MRRPLLLLLPILACACTTPGIRPRSDRGLTAPPQNPGGYAGQPVVLQPGSDYGSSIPRNSGILNLSLGARSLEDSRWAPLDDQFAGSLDYTFKQHESWIGLNVGLSGGGNRETVSGVDVDAWQAELSIGPRVYLPIPRTPLYLYGGVSAALAYGELEVNASRRTTDTFIAGIASAGLMFKLNQAQAIGFEWRTMQGSDLGADVAGAPNDANHQQFSLTFSAAF